MALQLDGFDWLAKHDGHDFVAQAAAYAAEADAAGVGLCQRFPAIGAKD
jgi:hypothetical protein